MATAALAPDFTYVPDVTPDFTHVPDVTFDFTLTLAPDFTHVPRGVTLAPAATTCI